MTFSSLRGRLVLVLAPATVLAVLAVTSVTFVAHAARAPKPDFQIKFATLAPDGSTWMKAMEKIDADVRARTNNRLGFKFYPGGVQGDEKDVLRKVRNGQLHAGGFTGYGIGSVESNVRVLELPFLFESLDELDHVREVLGPDFEQMFADAGWINLGWTDVGFVYLMSRNAIHDPDEMSRARMWVWSGDPLAELFFRAFSISPIPLAAPDVLTSLQTGIIDAVYASPLACVALQWYTRIKFMSDVPLTHGIGAALVYRDALEGVSDADIATLREVAAPHLRALTLTTREQNIEAVDEMAKEGVKVVVTDAAVRTTFFEKGRGAWGDGVGTIYSQELLDRVVSIVEEYRAR